ncbi:unnamed protein product [Lactuca virosa]|uniref:Uncharacterized protein n=1 Tax=Lactuca virosa TaxID=75947 RepID=A0AAU9LJB3_9ASTR|nr:unnamed protein product [Lactuca virosa]
MTAKALICTEDRIRYVPPRLTTTYVEEMGGKLAGIELYSPHRLPYPISPSVSNRPHFLCTFYSVATTQRDAHKDWLTKDPQSLEGLIDMSTFGSLKMRILWVFS